MLCVLHSSSSVTSQSTMSVAVPLQADSAGCALMGLAGGCASAESADYVEHKTQFQLHTMLTEQRHANTMNMSQTIAKDAAVRCDGRGRGEGGGVHGRAAGCRRRRVRVRPCPRVWLTGCHDRCERPLSFVQAGLSQIVSVDDDITQRLAALVGDGAQLAGVAQLEGAFLRCVREHKKVYVYGCGATGRLAKLMESTFWRPFWRRLATAPELADVWAQVQGRVGASVEGDLIGEMTGADRALISSLEGFEDLQLIGELQLRDRGVQRGDVVIAVTEGGETSSVIGTVRAALAQWRADGATSDDAETRAHLFFVYNNPAELLMPFHRSASVLQEEGISKINLATGPQAITGSTRMQATSSETFVIGAALHCALDTFLRGDCALSPAQMERVGFAAQRPTSLAAKLGEYGALLSSVKACVPSLARLTEWESACYASGRFTSYFATRGLMTVFIDNTERSPTFRLYALDTTDMAQRRCWLQVWTAAEGANQAWEQFLGRPFRGLEPPSLYEGPFRTQIDDPYLRATALRSLPQSGTDQAALYDFSFSAENRARRGGVRAGDLGVLVLAGEEEVAALDVADSYESRFVRLFIGADAPAPAADANDLPTRVAILAATSAPQAAAQARIEAALRAQGLPLERACVCVLSNPVADDPLQLRAQMSLKVALNAHSTGVMARLGKVLGNTMVNVSPSNLKLIGRATHLIRAHVDPAAAKAGLPVPSYALVNAVLYDSIDAIRAEQERAQTGAGAAAPATAGSQSAEVALSIIRILSSLAAGKPMPPADALKLLADKGLEKFLDEFDAAHSK